MKYKTKKQRIGAMIDTYRKLFKKTLFTTDEVASWAVKVGLWPIPKRGDSELICVEWEDHLEIAIKGCVGSMVLERDSVK